MDGGGRVAGEPPRRHAAGRVKRSSGARSRPAIRLRHAASPRSPTTAWSPTGGRGGSTFGTLVGNLATDVPEPSPTAGRTSSSCVPGSGSPTARPSGPRTSAPRWSTSSAPRLRGVFVRQRRRGAGACADSVRAATSPTASRPTPARHDHDPPDGAGLGVPPQAGRALRQWVTPPTAPSGPKVPPPGTGPYAIASYGARRGAAGAQPALRGVVAGRTAGRVPRRDRLPSGRKRRRPGRRRQARGGGRHEVAACSGARFAPPASARWPRATPGNCTPSQAPARVHVPEHAHAPVRRPAGAPGGQLRRGPAGAHRLAGGPDVAQSTCQLVPPGFPGYTPSCRYTANPGPGGAGADRTRRAPGGSSRSPAPRA